MSIVNDARKNPRAAYKCGAYSLDQLGRVTQPGRYNSLAVLQTPSSLNGVSAAQLLTIGQRAGMSIQAVFLNDLAEFPVPCVAHLNVGHFVMVRERRGNFYEVLDSVAYGLLRCENRG